MATKVLHLVFKGSLGKKHTIRLPYPAAGLDAEKVKAAMDKIAATKLFAWNGENLYETPISAKYVTTTEEAIMGEVAND